ncbi:MAG: hypothetical protein GXO89_01560 [Chlorobi bacterium]|nr:hypothetical protein [Chlorobiota bacterium]
MKTIYILFFILCFSSGLLSQEETKSIYGDKNGISLNADTYFANVKERSSFHFNSFALVVNYHRIVFTTDNFGMSGEIGIGVKHFQGGVGASEMTLDKTANVFLTGNYIRNQHRIDIGFGGLGSFEYGLWGLAKFRYIKFVENNKFIFVSFNQVVWYSSGYNNKDVLKKVQSIWFWDSKTNDFIVNFGIGITL